MNKNKKTEKRKHKKTGTKAKIKQIENRIRQIYWTKHTIEKPSKE